MGYKDSGGVVSRAGCLRQAGVSDRGQRAMHSIQPVAPAAPLSPLAGPPSRLLPRGGQGMPVV